MTQKLCIYHGNCADGFTAAWIVRLALGFSEKYDSQTSDYQKIGRGTLEFHAGFYQTPPPDVTGKIVYIVDFSYKRPIMEEIVKKAAKVIHIDHHDSAIKDMADFTAPNFESLYSPDNTESGAMLTWKYFYPTREVPALIRHVDDRDRWKFSLPGTSIAYPVDEPHLPEWFLTLPFDSDSMSAGVVDKKVENLVGCLNWDLSRTQKSHAHLETLFDFGG
jgi:oligoribonuclease NrnB/cAMP/cGMP phosphodiesterase (DHH superfamily)